MSVFKKRDVWKAEVFIGGRRVASKSGFRLRAEAKAWHDATRTQLQLGGDDPTKNGKPKTFDELLEMFDRLHLPKIRPSSQVRYKTDIERRIKPFFRFLKLDVLTVGLMEEFRTKCAAELKPRSANACLATLKTILHKGVRWGMLKSVPYGLENLAVPKKPYEWWSDRRHIEAFIREAKLSHYYGIYVTAVMTGMRYGEIVGLGKSAIDFEAGTIHVHRQWLGAEKAYGPPKHGKERWIDFDPAGPLGEALREAVARPGDPEILFPSTTGGHPGRSKVAFKCFRAVQRRAEVPLMKFHGLRHTFASWYMREHDSVWDLKALLGHADVQTTMRYAHHSRRHKRPTLSLGFTPKSRPESQIRECN